MIFNKMYQRFSAGRRKDSISRCGLFDKLLVSCRDLSQKKTTFPLFSQYAQTLLRSEVIRFLSRTQNHVLYCPIEAIANRIQQKQGPIAGIPIGNTGPGNLTL